MPQPAFRATAPMAWEMSPMRLPGLAAAMPASRAHTAALHCIDAAPTDALFIDDTPGHVATVRSLGMTGHVHMNTEDTLTRIKGFLRSPR
ncbi:hypothetical protein ACLB9X_04655 [Streptomyces sp. 5K101]|uniref:hypothetical protein n=1 Tax=Streptomyces sp. 5K101 TaxID=3390037 RepID=UPI003975B2BA